MVRFFCPVGINPRCVHRTLRVNPSLSSFYLIPRENGDVSALKIHVQLVLKDNVLGWLNVVVKSISCLQQYQLYRLPELTSTKVLLNVNEKCLLCVLREEE
jgi:hypothetical protein